MAHTVQCPYCIDAYTQDGLQRGVDKAEMMEAVHVAGAIRGGASLVHGVQMMEVYKQTKYVMPTKSLKAQKSILASTQKQLNLLSGGIFASGELPTFSERIAVQGESSLRPRKLEILQMNIGYMCNQVCAHCHVDAGPDRKEMMTRETLEKCLKIIETTSVHTLDLTGGAPEMHLDFRWFVERAAALGVKDFIIRSNLTIILANKKYNDLPEFFQEAFNSCSFFFAFL